jgi:uncharacterized damage-inducible protein DinB
MRAPLRWGRTEIRGLPDLTGRVPERQTDSEIPGFHENRGVLDTLHEDEIRMSIIQQAIAQWEFNRGRTLAKLDEIEKLPNPQAVLGWRPGPGRAHIAWQLMHVAITEELFATERLLKTAPAFPDLAPRFKGGSTPDDDIPTAARIREVLEASRSHLRQTMGKFTDDDLVQIPEAFRERGWTLNTALQVLSWHEAHHQGQTHITLNLWKAAQG